MYLNPTPQLSEEGTKEVLAELEAPKKDNPGLKKVREALGVVAKISKNAKPKKKEHQLI